MNGEIKGEDQAKQGEGSEGCLLAATSLVLGRLHVLLALLSNEKFFNIVYVHIVSGVVAIVDVIERIHRLWQERVDEGVMRPSKMSHK